VVALRASPHGRDERPAVCSGPSGSAVPRTLRLVFRRRAGAALLIATVLLGACSSGGSDSSAPEPAGRSTLEVRPIRRLLAPGDPTVPADADTVVEPSTGNGLRYAVGLPALSGPIVRKARARDLGGTGQGWIVDITLTPGATRSYEALSRHLAAQEPPRDAVAYLVDGVMEGQMTFEPGSPTTGSIVLAGDLSGVRARRLAASLTP
jgi:hypothetical protein